MFHQASLRLSGGGARMDGMAERIANATGLDVRRVPDPLHAVILGAAAMLGQRLQGGAALHPAR